MEELVSIVVPVYNVEAYLDECVQSLVDQTYRNLEIILVNDGSTDRCSEKCDTWAERDKRIKVLHKENAGLGMARNSGMDIAEGKYIFFFDSDDYVDTTTVEKCVVNAEAHGSDVVMFGRWDVYEDGRKKNVPITASKQMFQGDEVTEILLPRLFTYEFGVGISACGKMYQLQALKSAGIRFVSERKVISEDAYFVMELFAQIRTVTIVAEPLYYYRKRASSLSHAFREDRVVKNNAFLQECIQRSRELAYPSAVIPYFQARYHMYTISHMKQIMISDLSGKEKYAAMRTVFDDPILLQSVTNEAIRLGNRRSGLFWRMFRMRCFWGCWLLLWYKSHR